MVRLLDMVELTCKEDSSLFEHCDAVRNAFDFVEQMGGEEDGATFVSNRADNCAKNVTADNRVEAARWFVE
jgi:hypothetical protein